MIEPDSTIGIGPVLLVRVLASHDVVCALCSFRAVYRVFLDGSSRYTSCRFDAPYLIDAARHEAGLPPAPRGMAEHEMLEADRAFRAGPRNQPRESLDST